MNNTSFESHQHLLQQQDSLKRKNSILQMKLYTNNSADHHHRPINPSSGFYTKLVSSAYTHNDHPKAMFLNNSDTQLRINNFHGEEDENLLKVIPQVTVVLEGRSICQRISLAKHSGYLSLAKALRQMFVDAGVIGDHHLPAFVMDDNSISKEEQMISLSDAIPGHLIAYEDIEDDLLLAGDLNWKDFVRVAKRIRIIPVKAKSRRGRCGG